MEGWNYGKNCVVCGNPRVQMHHVLHGTSNRKRADQYGYVIPLCERHHTGDEGIHKWWHRDEDMYWIRKAQEHFEKYRGTREEFIEIFGRSWL